jgi:adenylate cyclase
MSLRAGLIALILASVVATAGLIHVSWWGTARDNVADIVRQLNREIIVGIKYEIAGILANATAARDALHTVFFQDVIDTRDEAKREFVVLAALQSQPNLSWAMIGWPDGTFFGARKGEGDALEMVEVSGDAAAGTRQRRIDSYVAVDGDIMFRARAFAPSSFAATAQPWYRRAVRSEEPVWADASETPAGRKPAIATAKRLSVYQQFVGVIAVALDFDRLSRYLDTITVGKTGSVYVVDTQMRMVALQKGDGAASAGTEMMPLGALDRPSARIVTAALAENGIRLPEVVEPRELRYRDPADGRHYFVNVTPVDFSDWYVATVAPEHDFLAEVERNTSLLLIQVAGLTLLAALLAALASNLFVAAPLKRVAGQLRHIEAFDLDRIRHVTSPLAEIDNLSAALLQMARGLASFQKFIPTALVRTLVSQGIEARPGGTIQPLSILFTDLVGFTHLSEALGDRIVDVLGRYLSDMSRVVAGNGGTIDKFIGDSVMAFWNAPLPDRDHAVRACRAALACQDMLREHAALYEDCAGAPLRMRIGINTGPALVGNIGSDERLNYTAIGDAVNVASRLEALNKRYGTEIIIGEATRDAAGEAIVTRLLDRVAVYGRMEGTAIYELLALPRSPGVAQAPGWAREYEEGFRLYADRRWLEAIERFERTSALRGAPDGPSRLMIARCRAFAASGPPADWNGVWAWDGK